MAIESKDTIAVLGGTFDPIHNGHIAVARSLRDELSPCVVLIVPAAEPRLRVNSPQASPSQRLHMAKLALRDETDIEICDVDVKRQGTTYTLDTVKDIREQYGPGRNYIFAIGADTVPTLHKWHRIDELLDICTFALIERPGAPINNIGILPTNTIRITGPMCDISASTIREAYANEEWELARSLTPPAVHNFIIKEGLYR